ncbi:MAG: hypothetical protein ACRC6M_18330 [Microcystaceae cyanobacterium]
MIKKIFAKKNLVPPPAAIVETVQAVPPPVRLSVEEQKENHKQRKQAIIDEFGKSVINFLYDEIWTPLHIIDLMEGEFSPEIDLRVSVKDGIQSSLEAHKEKLRGKIYRQSLNLQPGNLLIVLKNSYGDVIESFKDRDRDINKLVCMLNPQQHRLLFLRHFIPPIPDDLYQFDDVVLPLGFAEALTEIVNYCDLNYSLDNVTFDKWEKLVTDLSDSGVFLHLPNQEEEIPFQEILSVDFGQLNYNKITVKQVLKDTVDKQTIVIPLFVIFLAFFCSEASEKSIFPYHYLFTATGSSKERSMTRGLFSFPKLFNQLLDESLLPQQYAKCLAILYREAFYMRGAEIDDIFMNFRERYSPNSLA